MSHLNFDYVPLTFINDQEEIKKQIRNTLILIHLFEKYNTPARLEKLIEGTQYGYNASALQSGKNKFLRISDIHESKVNWDTVPFCNCDDEETYLLKKEDILIARTGGTTGKSFKIDNPPAHSIYAGYLIRIRAKKEVNPDYIYLFLHSFAYWSQIVNLNERNFRPKANAENLKSLILPDCPNDVQNDVVKISNGEIVKGYEELYSEIEKALAEYDKTQEVQKLHSDQLTQLTNLNKAILQEAVQGKLVPQDSKDEPASELLKRIKAEKAKSSKKEKPVPPIKPEEIPFEIPENWVWCRLGDAVNAVSDVDHRMPEKKSTGIPYISPRDFYGINEIDFENAKKISDEDYNILSRKVKPEIYDIIFPRYGTIGVCRYLDYEKKFLPSYSCVTIKTNKVNTDPKFVFYYCICPFSKIEIDRHTVKTTQPNVGIKSILEFRFPLPPLSEQKRIVMEIEKQFAKTKQLKEHIIANQQATEQLLKALLHQAFEVKEIESTTI